MDAQLMYTAAAGSGAGEMDSWDLENLRYLRKISKNCMEQAAAQRKLSKSPEESYCEDMSYQSHVNHPRPRSRAAREIRDPVPPRSRFEITTTTASVHNSSTCSGGDFLMEKNNNLVISDMEPEPQGTYNESDQETINEIEEFTSLCGNIRSIPIPDSKIGENMQLAAPASDTFDDEPRSLVSRPLDTCYQLDVLTIRNESVLANRADPKQPMGMAPTPTKIPKAKVNNKLAKGLRKGSDGYPSSSSSESSGLDEGALYGDRDACLHAHAHAHAQVRSPRKRSIGDKKRVSTSSPSSSSSAYSSSSVPSSERTAVCPFCDGVGARLPSSSSRTYYYMGENENGSTTRKPTSPRTSLSSSSGNCTGSGTEAIDHPETETDASLIHETCNDAAADQEAPPEHPRTPSPYYVRLRRDLITSYSPALCSPRNFGMDKQGQLMIDYSQNWIGLEKYIENLKLGS